MMKKRIIIILAILTIILMSLYILTPNSYADDALLENNTTTGNGTEISDEDELTYDEYWEFEKGSTVKELIEKQKEESVKWTKETYGEDAEVEFLGIDVYKLEGTKRKDLDEATKNDPLEESDIISTNLVVESSERYYKMVDGERQEIAGIGQGHIVATVIKGDITGKGDVDVTDLSQLQEQLVETTELEGPYKEAADMNSDKEIDIIDLSQIQEYIVNN